MPTSGHTGTEPPIEEPLEGHMTMEPRVDACSSPSPQSTDVAQQLCRWIQGDMSTSSALPLKQKVTATQQQGRVANGPAPEKLDTKGDNL